MSISNFIPTIWSTIYLQNFNKRHVWVDVCNRTYEGEAKLGDTVKISSLGRVTMKDYTKNAGAGGTAASPTIAGIERPEIPIGSSLFLTIDQQKYFNIEIDNVDKAQVKGNVMAENMREAAYSAANTMDQFVNSTAQTGVSGTGDGTGNRLAARTIGTGAGDSDAYETLVDLVTKLEENDVFDDYWAVVPPWYYGMLRKDDRLVGNGTSENMAILKNGKVPGMVGIDLRMSNNISGATSGTLAVSGGVYTIIVGVKSAITFAEQIDSMQAFTPDDGFLDAVKGLHVYGAKVTRPYALASVACTKA